MNHKKLIPLLLISLFTIACSQLTPQERENELKKKLSDLCGHISLIASSNIEPNWDKEHILGLFYKSMTLTDIVTHFGQPTKIYFGESNGCRYRYKHRNPKTFQIYEVTFLVQDDIVMGVEFPGPSYSPHAYAKEHPETINEAYQLFGKPNRAGYSTYLGEGIGKFVWIEQGIMIIFNVLGKDIQNAQISHIYYFPPMSEAEFIDSLWNSYIISANDATLKNPFE